MLQFAAILILLVSCDVNAGKQTESINEVLLSSYEEGFYAGYCVAWDEDAMGSYSKSSCLERKNIERFYSATDTRKLLLNNGAIPTVKMFCTNLSQYSLSQQSYNGSGLYSRFINSREYTQRRTIHSESDLQELEEYLRGFLDGFAKMEQIRSNTNKYNPSVGITDELKNDKYYQMGWEQAYNGIQDVHSSFEIEEGVPYEETAWRNFSCYKAGYRNGIHAKYPNSRYE